jgi:hypothetical protein
MKKILLFTIISISLHSIAKSQISKGSVLLGGGVNISNSRYENANTPLQNKTHENHTTINPVVGIAVKENLILGVSLGYGRSENTTNSDPTNPSIDRYTSYSGGIFLRKYLLLGKNFYLFGQGDLGYTDYNQKSSSLSNSFNQNGWRTALGFSPGISYALNKRFHLETSFSNLLNLSYEKYRSDVYSGSNQSGRIRRSFGFNSNSSPFSNLNIGFRFLFAK